MAFTDPIHLPPDALAALLRLEAKQVLRGCPTGSIEMTPRQARWLRSKTAEQLAQYCKEEQESRKEEGR